MEDTVLIAWYGPGRSDRVAELRRALDQICDDMTLAPEALQFEPLGARPWPVTPALVLWLADDTHPVTDEARERAAEVASAGVAVLPIVDRDEALADKLPEPLRRFNALFTAPLGAEWAEAVADEAAALIWQRRPARRVFVSYRRSEAEGVARQVWSRLTESGYEVFLDEVTIHKGVDFQAALRAWLVDADVLVMLLSPGFCASSWTMEELRLAQQSGTAVLALEWPAGQSPSPEWRALRDRYDADQRVALTAADLTPADDPRAATLVASKVAELLNTLRRKRAGLIRSTVTGLIAEAADRLQHRGPRTMAVSGDLRVDGWLVRAFPFRPTLPALYALYRAAEDLGLDGATALYHEHDGEADELMMFTWLSASRHEMRPNVLRVLGHTGGALAAEELAN